jgi:hypothetical protein
MFELKLISPEAILKAHARQQPGVKQIRRHHDISSLLALHPHITQEP